MRQADAELFEMQRPALMALAYRMLGERAEAQDIVQETWLRWEGADRAQVRDAPAWLRSTAARIAIDVLRSARKRREVYVGPWLPEPLVETEAGGPEEAFALAQECELALLWAMERLSAEERAAFILKEAFDVGYGELAETLGKSEAACRQLVSRAAKRVRQDTPRFEASTDETADLLARFAQAAAARDRQAVIDLLAPDVVAISDGGGKARAALRPLHGPEEVAQVLLRIAEKMGPDTRVTLGRANGSPAAMILDGGTNDMITVVAPDDSGLIKWIYVMRNPDKLPGVREQTA